MWYDEFNVGSFLMAEDVKWWQLEKALDMEFLVTTGRGLSSDALLYFCKFFGNSIFFFLNASIFLFLQMGNYLEQKGITENN